MRRLSEVDYIEQDCGFDTPCWVWQLYVKPNGYGQATKPGTSDHMLAHRLYYETAKGQLVDGAQVDHLCRNRACVNPDHLESVTCAENLRRGCRTKLTVDQVRAIRASSLPPREIAAENQVSVTTIYHIRSRRKWRDI